MAHVRLFCIRTASAVDVYAGNIRRAEHFITFMRRLITYMRERLGGARQVGHSNDAIT